MTQWLPTFLLEILFPERCLGCKKDRSILCPECQHKLPEAKQPKLGWVYAVFNYKDSTVRASIRHLKTKQSPLLVKFFARSIYDTIFEELANKKLLQSFSDPIVIPIPVSRKRLRERGYNQAEIIAKNLSSIDPFLKVDTTILKKAKETPKQAVAKNKSERLKNLKDSFEVANPGRVKGRCVILVDDVTTTGATLQEAKRVLKKAGAKQVIAATVAH